MKKRSREINVFSISALDLFASALGAFILMSLIFMVFFTMTSTYQGQAEQDTPSALQQCQARLALAEARTNDLEVQLAESVDATALQRCENSLAQYEEAIAQCQSQLEGATGVTDRLERASEELEACRSALRKTFLLVIASWASRDDIDLHMVDPSGREYYYAARRFSGSEAALEEDNTAGPGNEVWMHPAASPGRYRACYKLFNGTPSPRVRGSILWQEGKIELPRVSLTRNRQVRMVAEIIVDANGMVSLDRSRSGQILGTGGCR